MATRTINITIRVTGQERAGTTARCFEDGEGVLEMTLRWTKGTTTLDVELPADVYGAEDPGRAGTDDVVKSFRQIELPPTYAARGQGVLEDDEGKPLTSGPLRVDFGRGRVTVKGRRIRLTPTEYRLLTYLCQNAGRVAPYRTLRREVSGRETLDARDCLKVQVQRLRQKLGDNAGLAELIVNERGAGYRLALRPSQSPTTIAGLN